MINHKFAISSNKLQIHYKESKRKKRRYLMINAVMD